MRHYRSLDDVSLQGVWLTIGSFDGVHRGHQAIIQNLVAGARAARVPAVVLTFFPHPAIVLGKRQNAQYLTTPDERAALLGDMGVDVVITQPFTQQVASVSAFDFVTQLYSQLGIRHMCVGHDFALGRGREGNLEMLQKYGVELGYSMSVIPPVRIGDGVISSSQVRAALRTGDVARAQLLLGRLYQLRGQVVHGDKRGRKLGIPTANLDVWSERALPKAGVYACKAQVDGQTWEAVTNVGVRPTFENQPAFPQIEAHILDFSKTLYGRNLQLSFVARLRDEKRFPNVQALVDQIQQDITQTRDILGAG